MCALVLITACGGGGTVTIFDLGAFVTVVKQTFTGFATDCVDDTTNLTYNGTATVDIVDGTGDTCDCS